MADQFIPHRCISCNKECLRKTAGSIGKLKYYDENGKQWRSANTCPECGKLYQRRVKGHKPAEQLKSCKICNKEFLSNSACQLMCSRECATRNALNQQRDRLQASKQTIRICVCGKDITKDRASKQYCSRICRIKAKKPKKPNPIISCLICGESFERKQGAEKLCSAKCKKERHLTTKRNHKRKKTPQRKASNKHSKKLREMRERQRLPKWADKKAIKEFYDNCPEGMFVDHIVPLAGEQVTGLHTVHNFQYLSLLENSFKNRKFDGTYENESWRSEFKEKKN